MDARLRLLWITPELPRPGESAARARWWELLRRIAIRHDVTLLTFLDPGDRDALGELPPGLAAIHHVAREPHVPDDPFALLPTTVRGGFSNPALARAIAERLAAGSYDLLQLEFTELMHLVPAASLPVLLTVHQLGFARHLPAWRAGGSRWQDGAKATFRHLRDLEWELWAVRQASHVAVMSPEDAARLRRFLPDLPLSVSPVGVDTAAFSPPADAPPPTTDLLFHGNFGHPPNVDAVRFLSREILPRLARPATARVLGQGPAPHLGPSVEWLGAVPDVRPHLAAARVYVAPVRFGTGMRGKVLEALAMARPVVTTSAGAEGLGASHGRELLIAESATELAAAIDALLADPARAAALGRAGRTLVRRRFDWDAIASDHEALYAATLQAGPPPAAASPELPGAAAWRALGEPVALAAGICSVAARGLGRYGRTLLPGLA
jgi:glycosyltransferase involved in cell wall biosynthesis